MPRSLGAIIRSIKSVVALRVNEIRGTPGAPVWQRNYHEHTIREERELDRIRAYIAGNPARWRDQQDNPAGTGPAALERFRWEP